MEYGSADLNIYGKFYDEFENEITQIYKNETFTMTMQGNDMVKIDLVPTIKDTLIYVNVEESYQPHFARLVIADDYVSTLTYSNSES